MTTPVPVAAPVATTREDDRDRYASWTRRVVAWLLDAAVVATVSFVAGGPFFAPLGWVPWVGDGGADAARPSGWAFAATLVLLALQGWTGQTPGKRAVDIAVVDPRDGQPIGLLATIGRALAHLLDAFLLVGFLRPLWHRRRRTFADSVVGTDVLLDAQVVPLRWVARLRARRERPLVSPARLTAAAMTLCLVGVAAAVLVGRGDAGGGGWSCSGPAPAPGTTTPTLAEVEVAATQRGWERRLGIRRTHAESPASVTWNYAGPVTALTAQLTASRGPVEVRVDLQEGTATVDGADAPLRIEPGPSDHVDFEGTVASDVSHATVELPGSVDVEGGPGSWSAAAEPTSGAASTCAFTG